MEKLIERFVCTSTRCYTCGALVYAVEKKKTTNHVYHDRCFRCRICKRHLTEATLNEEGNDIYCTNCYRKKQRGDCSGLDFQRAADERAQYVHSRRHPDQPSPKINPRPPIQHDLSRHPSWTLRQLERQFLSHQEPTTKDFEKSHENYRGVMSASHPLTVRTSFSAPNNPTNIRRHSLLARNERSPGLQFFPVYSPVTSAKSESTLYSPKTPQTPRTPLTPLHFNSVRVQDKKLRSFNDFQPRLNQSSINLTSARTPSIERKPNLVNDRNQKYETNNKKPSLFYFPDTYITSNPHRSSSVNYSISPRKII